MSRQHFKIGKGISITPVASRPSDPENGDLIYNSTNLQFERYENGVWSSLGYSDEQAVDAVAAALGTSTKINFSYNDASNLITANIVTQSLSNTDIALNAGIALTKLAQVGVANSVLVSDSNRFIVSSGVTTNELNLLSGVTANVQTQFNVLNDNFISGGAADISSTSIFTAYNDSPNTTRPADGIGGTPSGLTTSTTTTNPIRGTRSFLLTKDAANRQGMGWAISNIALPLAYRGKPLRHFLQYLVNSGTFNAGSNGSSPTDGDVIVYFYDQTNNKLVESSNIKFLASSTTIVDDQSGTVQFDSNCTTVRMIIHIASTNASAWELKIDDVQLTNTLVNQGAFGTELNSSLTLTSNLTTNVQFQSKTSQDRDRLEVIANWLFTGTNTQAGPASVVLGGLTIDANKLPNSNRTSIGQWYMRNAGSGAVASGTVVAAINSGGAAAVFLEGVVPSGNVPFTIASGYELSAEFSVPIVGFSGSVKMSEPGDDRPFLVSAVLNAGQTIPHDTITKVNFNGQSKDTQGSYDSVNNRYRIFSSDTYRIHGCLSIEATTTIYAFNARLFVNGASANRIQEMGKSGSSNTPDTVPFDFTIDLKAGDYVEMFCYQGSGVSLNIRSNATAGQLSVMHIEKSSGSQQIGASELIAVSASQSSNQSFPHNTRTLINWNTEFIDTHGALNGTTYTAFTAQVIEASMQIGVSGLGAGTQFTLVPAITHNGTAIDERYSEHQGTTTTSFTSYPTAPITPQIFRMKAGDTITASLYHFNSSSVAVTAFNGRTFLNLKRIG